MTTGIPGFKDLVKEENTIYVDKTSCKYKQTQDLDGFFFFCPFLSLRAVRSMLSSWARKNS